MESHPIPQQISSYQFRLVGDMTLKQFFQLAGCCLVSIIFYAAKIPAFIKWPFIILFALLGVALAFLPFEDRPLETWILSFFRNIYSPTIFVWKKMGSTAVFYQDEASFPQDKIIVSEGEEKLKKYLARESNQKPSFFNNLEGKEKTFLNSIGQLFSIGGATSGQATISPASSPSLPFKKPIGVPIVTPPMVKPKLVVEENTPAAGSGIQTENVSPLAQAGPQAQNQAQFSLEAAPPSPPTVPNTIVGQVVDTKGKILEGAILEVRDASGRPVRALKSNKLGHFMVVTSLQDGRYEIYTEKDGYRFEPVYFEALGTIIPPIAIYGKIQINPVTKEVPLVN